MKIAILSPFYPFRGGMTQFSTNVYAELSKTNEVKAFTFKTLYPNCLFPGKTQFVPENEKDNLPTVDSTRILSTLNPISYVRTAKKINEYNPDYVIIAYWMPFFAPAFGTVCRLLNKNIKVAGLIHNAISHEDRFFEKPLAKYFFSKCDIFIVMSEAVRESLASIYKNATVLLQPHPIYDHYDEKIEKKVARQKLKIEENKKVLLFFGFIREYKGLDLLLEATHLLSNDYHLVIAGECYGDFSKYQTLIDQSPIKENISVFEQYISDEMVSQLFSAADVLILPYRSATQSGVIAVSLQMEIPMIATNVGSLGESINTAETGLVVNEVTLKSIGEGIIKYFEDIEKMEPIYIDNIRKQKELLSWKNYGKEVEKFLQENK